MINQLIQRSNAHILIFASLCVLSVTPAWAVTPTPSPVPSGTPVASVTLLNKSQTYDAMAAAAGVNVTFGNNVTAGAFITTFASMSPLLSERGDPTTVTFPQTTAYLQVAYSICFEALRKERTQMPMSSRLFLTVIDGNIAPTALSSITTANRIDVIQRMSQQFFQGPLSATEEASLLGLIQATITHASTLTAADSIPTLFAGACSVMLGSHAFVGN